MNLNKIIFHLFVNNNLYTHLTYCEKFQIFNILNRIKKKIIAVEIGSYYGASSCIISASISHDSRLYCIDTWANDNMIGEGDDINDPNLQTQDTFYTFLRNTKKYKDKIITIKDWSYNAINKLKEYEEAIDFLFIDGDHNYEGVKKDWDLYSALLKRDSIVVFHDAGWASGVIKVINDEVVNISNKIADLPNMKAFKIL